MKRNLLLLFYVVLSVVMCHAQQLPKSYYSKYYTPINNQKMDISFTAGFIFPTGIMKEQPNPAMYLEDPFKNKTGMGLKTGYQFQYIMKFSGGDNSKKRTNPRLMGIYEIDYVNQKAKWEVDDESIKITTQGFQYLAMGTGLDLSYSLKNICVLSAYYKLMGNAIFTMPGMETTRNGYIYKVGSPYDEDSNSDVGYFHAYGFAARYRKRLSISLEFRRQKINSEYTFTKANANYTGKKWYDNPDKTTFKFPAFFDYRTVALTVGFMVYRDE